MRKVSAVALTLVDSFGFFVSSNQTSNDEVAQQPVNYQTSTYAKYGSRDVLNAYRYRTHSRVKELISN